MLFADLNHKREFGQYYTRGNPFGLVGFVDWAKDIFLSQHTILEPFAGGNHIIRGLQAQGFADKFTSFDIKPTNDQVQQRDVLRDFPTGYDVIITNPPWLAKNSACRQGLPYPLCPYDNLYKHSLDLCLQNAPYVAALIPATYLQSGLFQNRLHTFIALHDKNMFCDTDNPVALALFTPQEERPTKGAHIYHDNHFIGALMDLQDHLPKQQKRAAIRFNDPRGKLGFIAFDNTRENSIRFCHGENLEHRKIGHTTRMITRIGIDSHQRLSQLIETLNIEVEDFRTRTCDVFLTPFKGLRHDGVYRRRMDYALARSFIAERL